MCLKWLGQVFKGTVNVPSPSDIVPANNIRYDEAASLILISLGGLNIPFTKPPKILVPYTEGTKSMDPVLDVEGNAILIQGADEENQKIMLDFIKVGDIAVYQNSTGGLIIHRVVEIGQKDGRYFRFKGDNNYARDPDKIRDSMVQYLYVGTIC